MSRDSKKRSADVGCVGRSYEKGKFNTLEVQHKSLLAHIQCVQTPPDSSAKKGILTNDSPSIHLCFMELLTTASLLTDISLWNKSDEPYIMSDMLTLLELQPTVINVLYNLEVHGLYIYFMIYSYLCF